MSKVEQTQDQKTKYAAYTADMFSKELPGIVKNLDASRSGGLIGGKQEKPVDISLSELVAQKYGLSMGDYIQKLGINTSSITLQGVVTMPDQNIRWIVPEIIRTAITLGMRQAPFYPTIITTDQPVSGLSVTMPYVNMSDAAPSRINEGETIPLGALSFGQKTVNLFKIGKGLKMTDEVKDYVSLDVMGIFFRDFGVQLGYSLDNLAIDVLLNGNLADGSEAAPVIGVSTVGDMVYRDLLRPWVRGGRIGRNYTTLLGNEEVSIDLLDLPEFKTRYSGTTQATLNVKSPVPNSADYYINGTVPDSQLLMVDRSAALMKLTAKALMLESERIVSSQIQGTYATLTTGFSKMYMDAALLIDNSVDFTTNGFPSYMDIDSLLDVHIEK